MLFLFWSGLGSGLAFFSLGSGSVGLLLGGFVSGFLCFFLVFFPLFYSLVRGGLGVLDHGAGLMVCLFFSLLIRYISRLDIPNSVHFVFDGPLHCRKVEKRSRLHACMQVHGL